MKHEDKVFEVYRVEVQNKIQEAGHVKTNDETIVPGYLNRTDKGVLKRGIKSSLKRRPGRVRGWR